MQDVSEKICQAGAPDSTIDETGNAESNFKRS